MPGSDFALIVVCNSGWISLVPSIYPSGVMNSVANNRSSPIALTLSSKRTCLVLPQILLPTNFVCATLIESQTTLSVVGPNFCTKSYFNVPLFHSLPFPCLDVRIVRFVVLGQVQRRPV